MSLALLNTSGVGARTTFRTMAGPTPKIRIGISIQPATNPIRQEPNVPFVSVQKYVWERFSALYLGWNRANVRFFEIDRCTRAGWTMFIRPRPDVREREVHRDPGERAAGRVAALPLGSELLLAVMIRDSERIIWILPDFISDTRTATETSQSIATESP